MGFVKHVVAWGALLLAGAGCAARKPAETSPLGPPAAADSAAVSAPQDSVPAEPAPPKPQDPPPREARGRNGAPPPPATKTSADSTATGAGKTPGTSELSVELAPEEREGLTAKAHEDLEIAERTVRGLRRTQLGPEKSERVRAVEHMIAAARAALIDDPTTAASLAHKARLLADEIASSS